MEESGSLCFVDSPAVKTKSSHSTGVADPPAVVVNAPRGRQNSLPHGDGTSGYAPRSRKSSIAQPDGSTPLSRTEATETYQRSSLSTVDEKRSTTRDGMLAAPEVSQAGKLLTPDTSRQSKGKVRLSTDTGVRLPSEAGDPMQRLPSGGRHGRGTLTKSRSSVARVSKVAFIADEPAVPDTLRDEAKRSQSSVLWGSGATELRNRLQAELEASKDPNDSCEDEGDDDSDEDGEKKGGNIVAQLVTSFRGALKAASVINKMRKSMHTVWGGEGNTMDVDDVFRELPIFRNSTPGFTEALMKSVQLRRFPPAHVIFSDGIQCASLFVITSGEVRVILEDVQIATLTTGSSFGENYLLGLDTHTHTSMLSWSHSCIAEIERKDFLEVARKFPAELNFFEKITHKNRWIQKLGAGTLHSPCSIFKGLSQTTMMKLDHSMLRRVYFPGENLVEEGEAGQELFILVQGSVSVEIAGRIVRDEKRGSIIAGERRGELGVDGEGPEVSRTISELSADVEDDIKHGYDPGRPVTGQIYEQINSNCGFDEVPLCFGELGFLGVQDLRSATIVARSPCHVRVLNSRNFMNILQVNNESLSSNWMGQLQMHDQPQSTPATHVLKTASIFKDAGCSDEFLDFVCAHLEDRMFLKGQTIIHEKDEDRCMYLLQVGSASVVKDGDEVATLEKGVIMGEITVLGLSTERTCTIVAKEACWCQVIHQSVVIRGLEIFPEERRKVLMAAFRRSDATVDTSSIELLSQDDANTGTKIAFIKVLEKCDFFAKLNREFLERLGEVATVRIYMTGDKIIEEGRGGDSMFVMIAGNAGVFVKDKDISKDGQDFALSRVGTIRVGMISGELAMLGVSSIRSATIEADTICTMWEVTQEKGMSILQDYPDAQKHFSEIIKKHMERTVPGRLLNLPLFKDFDRKLRTLLGLYCERCVYFPARVIAKEGSQGDALFILNQGMAILEKKGITIKIYASGACFACTVMLGIHKYHFCTVRALQTCHVLTITRTSYMHSLEQYPSQAISRQFSKKEAKAEEELRDMIQRTLCRKQILKKYQDVFDTAEAGEDTLRRCFQSWARLSITSKKTSALNKQKLNKTQESIDDWVRKRQLALPRPKMPSDPLQTKYGRTAKLKCVLQKWPSPKNSPHYSLRIWNVLSDAIETRPMAEELLPILPCGSKALTSVPSSSAMVEKGANQFSQETLSSQWSLIGSSDYSCASSSARTHCPNPRVRPRQNPLAKLGIGVTQNS